MSTDEEWKTLEKVLGMSQSEVDDTGLRGKNEGGKLAGQADLWEIANLKRNGAFYESGFSALPGGFRDFIGYFNYLGSSVFFWSSSEYSSYCSWNRLLYYNTSGVYRHQQ